MNNMKKIIVKLKKCKPEKNDFEEKTYQVPFKEQMTVLMALQYIYEKEGVVFRHSCDIGLCAICAVKVNGKNRLACKEIISNPDEVLTIEPAGKQKGIIDLVTALK